jgi:hypothetical protein
MKNLRPMGVGVFMLLQLLVIAGALFGAYAPPQSRMTTVARMAFSARLDGGSKGVPSNLPGTLYVSPGRVEFEAFPQVEYLVWSCKDVKAVQRHRGSDRQMVTLRFTVASYRFDLDSTVQSARLASMIADSCKPLTEP